MKKKSKTPKSLWVVFNHRCGSLWSLKTKRDATGCVQRGYDNGYNYEDLELVKYVKAEK